MHMCVACGTEGFRFFVADEDYTEHLADMHDGIKVSVVRPSWDGLVQEF
jgi:hypothetical protein